MEQSGINKDEQKNRPKVWVDLGVAAGQCEINNQSGVVA